MNISWIGSPNYTAGRSGKIEFIVCHWMAGTLASADSVFQNTTRQTSAHYGVGQGGNVHQYVKESDTAWHSRQVNPVSIGIEHEGGPTIEITNSVYDTSAELIASIWKRHGIIPLYPHNKFVATQCSGTLDLDRLYNLAIAKYKGGTMDPQIIQNADNWFNRCNKTIMFTRGRQMSRDEFAPQVGRKFINFVEDAEDFPEAEANLRTIEIGKANKIQDTTYWYQVTDKLMLTARGRKWATNNEFKLQVGRSFIDTVNDIFSGPEYEAHQRRVIDALSNNTTLQTQITTLQSELNQCRANQGSGVPQATIDTINETNGIVKAIKVTVDFIKTFLTSIFRGGN